MADSGVTCPWSRRATGTSSASTDPCSRSPSWWLSTSNLGSVLSDVRSLPRERAWNRQTSAARAGRPITRVLPLQKEPVGQSGIAGSRAARPRSARPERRRPPLRGSTTTAAALHSAFGCSLPARHVGVWATGLHCRGTDRRPDHRCRGPRARISHAGEFVPPTVVPRGRGATLLAALLQGRARRGPSWRRQADRLQRRPLEVPSATAP